MTPLEPSAEPLFHENANRRLGELASAIEALRSDRAEDRDRARAIAFEAAHSLHGLAGIAGLGRIERRAARIEQLCAGTTPDAELLAGLESGLATLRRALSRVASSSGSEAPTARRRDATASALATILHVDDDSYNRKLVEVVLAQRPHVTIVSTAAGGEAVALAREHRPRLILLDLHLRDYDGEEVLRLLRGDTATRAIPVVVISADVRPDLIESLKEAGASDFIAKPIDFERLLGIVDAAVT